MSKPRDWRSRLSALVIEAARRPFAYGRHDCFLFVAEAIRIQGGPDIAAEIRGRYTTYRGGLRVLRSLGYDDHFDLIRRTLPEKPVSFAAVGDIAAIVREGAVPSLGIVGGAHVVCPLHEATGTASVPLLEATHAFGVG